MKLIYRFVTILFLSCAVVACGGSKGTTKQDKKEVKVDKCVKEAQKKPEIRAWGHGAGFTISEAINVATLDARGKMANSISSTIEVAIRQASELISKGTRASGIGASNLQDRQAEQAQSFTSYAKETVNNTIEIDNTLFELEDGTYECYVCVEYRDGVEKLTEGITNKVFELMSEEEKAIVKQNLEEFRQSVRESLGKNK